MIPIYIAKTIEGAKPVVDSYGNQVVIGHAQSGRDHYVAVVDTIESKLYIMKLVSPLLLNQYSSSNFLKIEDQEEFAVAALFFTSCGLIPMQ